VLSSGTAGLLRAFGVPLTFVVPKADVYGYYLPLDVASAMDGAITAN
jgi:hypothetical protein